MKLTIPALAQPFARAHFPNTVVNLLAPLASYAIIPFVANKRLERSSASEDEKTVLLAREVAGQGVNAGIQILNFTLGMLFGNRVGNKAFSRKLLGGFSQEGSILLITAGLNFLFYTFVRPWLGITVLDHWMKRHMPLPDDNGTKSPGLAQSQPTSVAQGSPFAVFSRHQLPPGFPVDQQSAGLKRVEQFL